MNKETKKVLFVLLNEHTETMLRCISLLLFYPYPMLLVPMAQQVLLQVNPIDCHR